VAVEGNNQLTGSVDGVE